MHEMTRGVAVWLLAVVVAACGNANGPSDATGSEDAATDDDAVALDGSDADAGVGGDTAAGAETADGSGDAKPTKDVATVIKGCLKDADCAGLQVGTCQQAACSGVTGLCGVVNLADDVTCPNAVGDLCKVGAVCKAGLCKYALKSCDDGNPCTDDVCTSGAGCTKEQSKQKLCNDGSACTTAAQCLGGSCQSSTKLDCDDKLPCTDDKCDPTIGCVHTNVTDGGTCDDGLICTNADACSAGKCLGKQLPCSDDNNPCTVAACTEQGKQGCTSVPVQAQIACNDGLACTTNDACSGTVCSGVLDSCDDKNPCTDDSCDAQLGCVNKNNDKPCSGTDACSASGSCKDGSCGLVAANCDDGNLCTADSCDKALGCQNKNQASPCFDGSVCTENDACDNGACKGGTPLVCDDKDACTADTCDAAKGCAHNAASYGTPCGTGKQCAVGLCLADDCGDGLCAPTENATSCDKDCPLTGGACAATDTACIGTCQTTKCGAPDTACKAAIGCPGIGSCLTTCGADLPCQIGCIKTAATAAFAAFSSVDQCVQAFCVQDFWMGKKCTGAGPNYGTCVDACEGAMCKLLWLQCKASTGCTAVRGCLQACNGNDDPGKLVACIADCKTKGSAEELLKNADLDTCSTGYCQ